MNRRRSNNHPSSSHGRAVVVKVLVVGGTTSGVGKTTLASTIVAAIKARGHSVRAFKVGPDYIDPSYLSVAAGSPCRNLDSWLLTKEAVAELFLRAASRVDFAVIEGVMGLFDGHSPDNDIGSAAEIAKLLGAPVLLAVDASKVARSVVATVAGYKSFDTELDFAGVVFNGVSGEGHLRFVKSPVEHATGLKVFGYMPRRDELKLPERHLGLVPALENSVSATFFQDAARILEETIDFDGIIGSAKDVQPSIRSEASLFSNQLRATKISIGLARDEAFNFYYEDSLDLLRHAGAEIVPFSPLKGSALPKGVSGIYIGGGFPEVFAADLAANRSMKKSLRDAAKSEMPIYGECGGLMYLGQSLTDLEGVEHDMVGIVTAHSVMSKERLSIGYRTVRSISDGPILRCGEAVRGHEFHWSTLRNEPEADIAVYSVEEQGGRLEGFRAGSVTASYVHVHLGSRPGLAERFVRTCETWQRSRR